MLASSENGHGDPPFLLLHGWTCDRSAMEPVTRAFAATHRCIAVDLLGHGASPDSDDLSIEAQARAAASCLPDGAIVIGHSMGGQIALQLAVDAVDRVSGVVLLDPAPVVPHDGARAFGAGMLEKLMAGDVHEIVGAFARRQILRASDPDATDRLVAGMQQTRADVARRAWAAIGAWDGRGVLERVACPVLLIATDKPSNFLPDMTRVNRRVTTAQVAGSGHMLQFEVMDQIKTMIDRWLLLNGLTGPHQPA